MPNVAQFIATWGYAAIVVIVLLGNLGLPIPEETILTMSGYFVWQGHLRFLLVVLVGVLSAVAGDNVGYWLGRRYGQRLLARWTFTNPARLEHMQRLVVRYGALAVFVARFVAGLRCMAGPLAGMSGLPPARFLVANVLGATVYVPIVVGIGYAIGYGLGDRIERLRHAAGDAEHVVLLALGFAAVIGWIVFVRRARRRLAVMAVVSTLTLGLLAADAPAADGLPVFKVTGQYQTAIALLVPKDTPNAQLKALVFALRKARQERSLRNLIPPTTPRGDQGPYSIVVVHVYSAPEWATAAALEKCVKAPAGTALYLECARRIRSHYYYTSVRSPEHETGSLGYAEDTRIYTKEYEKLF